MATKKDLTRYYEMEKHSKLHENHRKVIKTFNRLANGDPEKNKPGCRTLIVGEQLERVVTSAIIGLFTISDSRPASYRTFLDQIGNELVQKTVKMERTLVAGNIIVDGLPGGGKTYLVETLAAVCGLPYAYVQMTPDLTPRDLIVTTVLEGNEKFTYFGPVFSPILLADEINRATPKTQSALLQRMSSGLVSYKEGGRSVTKTLPEPCITIATQNPIEQEGTYPLPEAQLDRFLYKVRVNLPSLATLEAVVRMVPAQRGLTIEPLTTPEDILSCRDFISENIDVPEKIIKYITRLIYATYDPYAYGAFPDLKEQLAGERLVTLPPNSRAALHLRNSSQTLAAIAGFREVTADHVKKRFYEVVNHRFKLNNSLRGLYNDFGGADEFIKIMILGNEKTGRKGLLDVVPVEGD